MLFDMVGSSRVGTSLRTLRERIGVPIDVLAELVDVHPRHLRAIEEGGVVPSSDFVAQIVDALLASRREVGSRAAAREVPRAAPPPDPGEHGPRSDAAWDATRPRGQHDA